jgi:hypothetical protein
MTEKLSNEVAARTKRANARIGERFTDLAQRQIERMIDWLEKQAPNRAEIEKVLARLEKIQEGMVG